MNKIILSLVAGLSLLLSGCGGGGSLNASAGSVNIEEAIMLLKNDQISVAFMSMAPSEHPNVPAVLPPPYSLTETETPSCVKETPQKPSDEDDDGIPLRQEVRFNCGRNAPFKAMGMFKVVDHNDKGADSKGWAGGFRYDFDFTYTMDISALDKLALSLIQKGFFEVKRTPKTMIYTSDYSIGFEGDSTDLSADKMNWKWQSLWKNIYTPEDMAAPFAAGSVSIDGFFGVSGAVGGTGNKKPGNLEVVFALKSNGLKYKKSCNVSWEEGSLILKDGSRNEIRLEYSCDRIKFYFNGQDKTSEFEQS